MCEKKGLKFNIIVDKTVKFMFNDNIRIVQALMNLVQNAIKFTFKGEITVSATKCIANLGEKDSILFSVSDTGIGIKDEEKATLFDQFATFDEQEISVGTKGMGLGLSIVKYIARLVNNDPLSTKVMVDS
mmetsp:Transcript_2638/g.2277  ORF Transcript_2638/g.2277 Transcript_2638/m.2277 type:complete len:130 (+) Transcript_2638:86-475(+)